MIAPWTASVYMTAIRPPITTYNATTPAKPSRAVMYGIPRVVSMKRAPPISTAAVYRGIAATKIAPVA